MHNFLSTCFNFVCLAGNMSLMKTLPTTRMCLVKMACWGSVTNARSCVPPWLCGMARTRFWRNASLVSPELRLVEAGNWKWKECCKWTSFYFNSALLKTCGRRPDERPPWQETTWNQQFTHLFLLSLFQCHCTQCKMDSGHHLHRNI